MAQKRGKGGYGSENYDPETGRYIKDDNNTYHAGVGQSVADIIADLKAGYYDDAENGWFGSQFFANDNDDELEEDEEVWENKNALISWLQEQIDQANTTALIENTNFPEISEQEYWKYANECEQKTTLSDQSAFRWYKGNPSSFEFNKALRFGFAKFYEIYPQFAHSPDLNQQAITDRAKKMDNLTNSWEFPEDKKVIRFVDTAPLISWFKYSGIFDDMQTKTNQYNLEMLLDNYDKKEVARRLQGLVGTKVPPDGSFTSFSCMSDASHMIRNLDNNKRTVLIRYNVRKGTKAWISDYNYESEGLFNRTTGFFIQGAGTEIIKDQRTGDEYEVVVLEYGVQ